MLFSSPIFLFLFLPTTLLLYYLAPKRFKNVILLFLSLAFYTWGEKELVALILLSTLIDYSSGLIISNGYRKTGLALSIVFNLSLLFYFKYSSFIFNNLSNILEALNISNSFANTFNSVVLPIGISFYTFQTMSYTIDVYRGNVKATKNLINFATYVTLFPQLIAGPIVRYAQIENELKNRKTSINLFADGVERFIIGLAKKMIIANNCAFIADAAFNIPSNESSALIAWLGVIAYSFQIYFDFSGYSDMAIGLGKMFGFNFPENFNYPYISKSIREFWRRWHITLSNWFKDYLYISLGGNRKGNTRTYLNLLIVFLLTGLWHGASWNFIIWGLFHGCFLVLERIGFSRVLNRTPKYISHIYTLLVIIFGWVFFRSNSFTEAINYIKTMFSFNSKINFEYLDYYLSKDIIFILILALFLSTPLYKKYRNYIITLQIKSNSLRFGKAINIITLTILLVISYFYIATDAYNPFIYFRF